MTDEQETRLSTRSVKMETLGFVFGMSAMSFAIIGWSRIAGVQNELKDLKKRLDDAGVLTDQDTASPPSG